MTEEREARDRDTRGELIRIRERELQDQLDEAKQQLDAFVGVLDPDGHNVVMAMMRARSAEAAEARLRAVVEALTQAEIILSDGDYGEDVAWREARDRAQAALRLADGAVEEEPR